MERWQLLILQIFAVCCTYLITSTTLVSALEIRIFASGGQETPAAMASFSDLAEEVFSFPYQQNYQYVEIKLSSKDPAAVIKKIYLFRCKDFNPVSCIKNGIKPVISVNSGDSGMAFDETYKWDDVSSNNVGNFLTMVKMDLGGKEVWTGSWDKATKTGIRNFYHAYYEADSIDLYLKSGVSADAVKSYVENYDAIPSENINRTVFSTVDGSSVSKIYDLSGSREKVDPSGTGVPSFYSANSSSNVFNRSLGAFDFVFAGDGKISNPVVFYSASAGPPAAGGANLVIGGWSPQVVTCGGADVIHVDMHVENASMGYFQSYYYTIGGTRAGDGTITCSMVNPNSSIYSYQCSIPVSDFPVCNAPGAATITVYFNYQNGAHVSGSFPVTLKAPTPRLTVASLSPSPFDCGIDRWITANLQVSNPSGESLKKYYSFDGKNFNELKNCTGSGASYACAINETTICQLLQENLELTFKLAYGSTEVLSLPANVMVTFPPPSIAIDTVTPQSVMSGNTTSANVLLHVNYPDFITYNDGSFNYKYLNRDFASVRCSLENSYPSTKYYKCPVSLEIPSSVQGTGTLSFRLDGYKDGSLKQLTANSFFTILPPPAQPSLSITSVSPSPLSCIQNPSLAVSARADNVQGTPQTQYSVDGGKTYKSLTCSPSGNSYTCTIPKDDLCGLMSTSLTLLLKFTYAGQDVISNPQNVYIDLPEPHMQVYSIAPDTLTIGGKTGATVNLFVQYPKMVGDNPAFLYSYLGKTNQKMTCTKVSSTSNRDFYECANTQFDIPADYSQTSVPVLFAIQGTTISFPMNVPVTEAASINPWMEIVSTTPSRIEMSQGNETTASFYVTVHNAAGNNLKHQATLIPNSWITAGTCTEASVQYDFNCAVTINAPKTTAKVGANSIALTLRMTDGKTYDVSNTTSVYVIPEEAMIDVQSIAPETLYCEGQKQTNPDTVKVTANAKNLAASALLEEEISFNGNTIAHTAKYCTQQAQGISCNIPTDKLLEKVSCGSGELVPGGGTRYYPLTLKFLAKTGDASTTISGSHDVSVAARPLEPYLEIADNDVADGVLQSRINCLDSQAIKLGDSGYVRIMYADLLHAEAKDDLKWSFTLNAQDEKGKLTKGMGVSPEANATICTLKTHQQVGAHRIENYECSLYTSYSMFQRCANGDGSITLTATSSGGKTADGSIDVRVIKDDSKYQFDFDILTGPTKDIDCQIQSYGNGAQCSLASYSNQNVTVRVYNNNADVGMADLSIYDFDVKFNKDAAVSVNEHSLGSCTKDSKAADKYMCPFQIDPVIRLPDAEGYNVTKSSNQTDFPPIPLGSLNVTIYVKYAADLERKSLSRLDGTVTIHPKKSDSMINAEKMLEKMRKTFDSFMGIFKWVTLLLSFCAVCVAGNAVVDNIEKTIQRMKGGAVTRTPGTPSIPSAGGTTTPDVQKIVTELVKKCEDCTNGKISGGIVWCPGLDYCASDVTDCSLRGGVIAPVEKTDICKNYYQTSATQPSTKDDCLRCINSGGQLCKQPVVGCNVPGCTYQTNLPSACDSLPSSATQPPVGGAPSGGTQWYLCTNIYTHAPESSFCTQSQCDFQVIFTYAYGYYNSKPACDAALSVAKGGIDKLGKYEDCVRCIEGKIAPDKKCWCDVSYVGCFDCALTQDPDPTKNPCRDLSYPTHDNSVKYTVGCEAKYSTSSTTAAGGAVVATSPSITGAQTAGSQTGSSSDTTGIIGSLAIAVGLVLTALIMTNQVSVFGLGNKDVDKEKNDIMNNMKKGIEWGFATCVLPRIVGDIGGFISKKETGATSGWTKGFKGVSAFGQSMDDVCKMLIGFMPMIMSFINFYIQYLQFEMCMQMVEMQMEAGATASASASGPYAEAYQAQAQAQTAMGMSQQMMSCFSTFSQSLQQLTNSMAYMGNYMGTMGSVIGQQAVITYSYAGQVVKPTQEGGSQPLCGGQTLIVIANLCNGGVNMQNVVITGNGCGTQQGQCQQICSNMMQMMPTYSMYSSGMNPYGGSMYGGTSAAIPCQLSLAGCKDGAITITASGVATKTQSFTYKSIC